MRKGETRVYKGCRIRKVREDLYLIGGFMDSFSSWAEAKEAVDAVVAEERALEDAEEYVQTVLGGYM